MLLTSQIALRAAQGRRFTMVSSNNPEAFINANQGREHHFENGDLNFLTAAGAGLEALTGQSGSGGGIGDFWKNIPSLGTAEALKGMKDILPACELQDFHGVLKGSLEKAIAGGVGDALKEGVEALAEEGNAEDSAEFKKHTSEALKDAMLKGVEGAFTGDLSGLNPVNPKRAADIIGDDGDFGSPAQREELEKMFEAAYKQGPEAVKKLIAEINKELESRGSDVRVAVDPQMELSLPNYPGAPQHLGTLVVQDKDGNTEDRMKVYDDGEPWKQNLLQNMR